MWQLSAKDQAAIEFQRAQADVLYLKEGLPFATVLRRLRENATYDISDDDIKMAEEIDLAIPEETSDPNPLDPKDPKQPQPGDDPPTA
jgi:hypothetical protein